MERGELWWADMPDPSGHEAGFRRPVLVVQSNRINASRWATVLVTPLSSNLSLANAPGSVIIDPPEGGLRRRSVVTPLHLTAMDRSQLDQRIGKVSQRTMNLIDSGLCLVLSIEPER